jgi:hypothetical protein
MVAPQKKIVAFECNPGALRYDTAVKPANADWLLQPGVEKA